MKKAKLTQDEFNNLKKFIKFFAVKFLYPDGKPTNGDVISVLEAMEKTAPANAKAGLMMAVNDCVEIASDWNMAAVSVLDAELKMNGIITLTELRHQYSKQYARVIKRGLVKTDGEYYLLKGVLDDGSLEIPASEQQMLADMLCAYEAKIGSDASVVRATK